MPVPFFCSKMIVIVYMGNHMGMSDPVMGMHNRVGMSMHMMFYHGIIDNKYRSDHHKQQRQKIHCSQFFSIHNKGKKSSDKWRNRIVCTGLCCSQISLRPDIKKNAQSIGDKSQQHGSENTGKFRYLFPQKQSNDKGTSAGKYTLQHHNLVCTFI